MDTEAAVIMEQESLILTRNLLQIAIYNISYIRGLFHEKYFSDKPVPALEMKIKKLMPMDAESRRLIDWMEKGVYDALQRKYLKTLLFCICEKEEGPMIEEYAFSFSYPNTSTEEAVMNMSRTGSKKGSTTFTSNASEVTPDQMRSSACKMIRTLVSLMRTLDPMPEERTILMKLLYYDDVTPEDYEPPFFKPCTYNKAIDTWEKNPLNMERVNVNSKQPGLALEVHPSEVDPPKDAAHEEELRAQVKEWIYSRREIRNLYVSDVLSNFPDIPVEMIEDIMERLLKDGVLYRKSKHGPTINKIAHAKLLHAEEVLDHEVPTDDMTVARLEVNLDDANQATKIVHDGYVKNSADKILDKSAVHSESTNRKLLKIKSILKGNEFKHMDIDTKREYSDTESKAVLVGSSVTSIQELQEVHQNVSMQSGQKTSETDNDPRTQDLQRTVVGSILCINPQPALHFWNLDSGASNHICGGYTWVKNKRKIPKEEQTKFYNAANKRVKFDEVGDILSKRLRLHNVYLSKDLEELELYISIGQLTSNGYSVLISDEGNFTIHMAQNFNHIVGRGVLDRSRMAYMVTFLNDSVLECESTEISKEDLMDEDKIDDEIKGDWVLDSGCPYHVTNEDSSFTRKQSLKKVMKLGVAGEGSTVSKVQGDVSIRGLQLKSVYFCSKFRNNLISVPQLNVIGYKFFFLGDTCRIAYREENRLIGLAHKDIGNNNYYVQFFYSK